MYEPFCSPLDIEVPLIFNTSASEQPSTGHSQTLGDRLVDIAEAYQSGGIVSNIQIIEDK